MGELASKDQLRMSLTRWALVLVPAIVFLGFLSGQVSGSGGSNPWFVALVKPAINPPAKVFPVVWTLLYVMMGVALAMIVDARGAKGRGKAIGLFGLQFAMNLAWSPLFFAAHQVFAALLLILAMLVVAIATAFAFAGIRKPAAWLMLPYILWLCFACVLNWEFHRLNPNAASLEARPGQTEVKF
jgi:translocator protein